jgi:hypothetical protein
MGPMHIVASAPSATSPGSAGPTEPISPIWQLFVPETPGGGKPDELCALGAPGLGWQEVLAVGRAGPSLHCVWWQIVSSCGR